MPLPPPPADALISSGKPARCAAATSAASDWSAGVSPGTTGTPAACMVCRAAIFEPIAAIASGGGPTKISPASRQARANPAFSARNP